MISPPIIILLLLLMVDGEERRGHQVLGQKLIREMDRSS